MIEINNLSGRAVIPAKIFSTVAKKILSGENKKRENISLAFVDKKEMQKLNKKFRRKNKPTDVLSFVLSDGCCLGEIVICPDVVLENAKKFNISNKKEMLKVFVHGLLHLCGYDHEKSEKEAELMNAKEEKYLSKVK